MADDIPPVPPETTNPDVNRRDQDQREFDLLRFEADGRKLQNLESVQRLWLRWLSVALGIIVIVAMVVALWHMAHAALSPSIQYISPAFAVASIVAPIFSITAITVTILIGAFRRFGDRDLEGASAVIPSIMSTTNGQ
jgi:hypothetical protein